MSAPIKKTGAPTPAGVLHCHHRRKLKHTICAVCQHSFSYCPECEEDGRAESCAGCKAGVQREASQWFSLMHNVTEAAA